MSACKDKLRLAIFGLWTALCVSACTEAITSEYRRTVNFQAEIITRATGKNWEKEDRIRVTILKPRTSMVLDKMFNRCYRVDMPDSVSLFTPLKIEEAIYFPKDEEVVDFVAYHPCREDLKTLTAMPVSVIDQKDWKTIDLLVARNAKEINRNDTNSIWLEFYHCWTALEFKFSPGDVGEVEKLTGASVMLKNVPGTGVYDILADTLRFDAPTSINTVINPAGTKASAVVFPMNDLSGVLLEVTLKNRNSYTARLDGEPAWKGGMHYTYNITLKNKPAPVDVSVNITDWMGNEYKEGILE